MCGCTFCKGVAGPSVDCCANCDVMLAAQAILEERSGETIEGATITIGAPGSAAPRMLLINENQLSKIVEEAIELGRASERAAQALTTVEHVFITGQILGVLLREKVKAVPVMLADNYSDSIVVVGDGDEQFVITVRPA